MVKLYAHQEAALEKLSNGKILVGDVGSGKSLTAVAYYMRNEAPKDVYVITTAKKRDKLEWDHEFLTFGVSTDGELSRAGKLTVDSWNNIDRYLDVKDAFFIWDEQRVVGKGAWTKAFLKITKRNNWVLLSATPGDTWMDYIPVFLANGFYQNRTEFVREHVVYAPYVKFPKVDRYLGVGKLIRLRNEVLVEMSFTRSTVRHIKWQTVDHDVKAVEKATKTRWNPFTDEPMKDIAELFRVVRKIVNSDGSRINAVRELMQAHPRLIIFYNFDYELMALRELVSGDSDGAVDQSTVIAEWNGHKHEEVPTGERWVYLVQYTAGAEGWNCVTTNAMVLYSLNYSYKTWHQAFGRIDRLNTRYVDLYYYALVSTSWIDLAIKKALRSKQNFNEKQFEKGL